MSRDIAAAVRIEATPAKAALNHLLERQIAEARDRNGAVDVQALLQSISSHYDRADGERRGIVRSMQLMSDEAQSLTREIREQNASHLQAILDNVKDAIVTLDESGHIETFNPTGERIFGYLTAEILGRALDFLLPEIDPHGLGPNDYLERLATKIDDTHIDLAAHQTWGRTQGRNRIAVEIAVSKAKLNGRDGYIVCIRDITERKRAEAAAAGEQRVFEKIAANASLTGVLDAICEVIERVMPGANCAINLLDQDGQSLNFGVAPSLPRSFCRGHGFSADRYTLWVMFCGRPPGARRVRRGHRDRCDLGVSPRRCTGCGIAGRLVVADPRIRRPGSRHIGCLPVQAGPAACARS